MANARGVEFSERQRSVAGSVICDWRYKTATIHLNFAIIFHMADDAIDYVIRHEICHLLLAEMREYGNGAAPGIDHEERACTELAMVLGWVWAAGEVT